MGKSNTKTLATAAKTPHNTYRSLNKIRKMSSPSKMSTRFRQARLIQTRQSTRNGKEARTKIDVRLMPMLILLYLSNYLDRNSITTARDNGLVRDLKLQDQQYQTALSILFVGYITFQIPSNLLMTKLGKPSLYLPACVTCGASSPMHRCCHRIPLPPCRPNLPRYRRSGFLSRCSCAARYFFRKEEMATRTALLFSGSIISNAFSGLISAGILSHMDGKAGLPGWKWLFIIEAIITPRARPHRCFRPP